MNSTFLGEENHTLTPYKTPCFVHDSTSDKSLRVIGYIVIILVSFMGNSLLFHAAAKDKSTRKSINYFIANICVANLLITVVYMPRTIVMIVEGTTWLISGTLGLVLCKVVPAIHHACILVSILSLAALSVDRFLYIVTPTKQFLNSKKLKVVLPAMWVVAILVRVPSTYARKLNVSNDQKVRCAGNLSEAFQSQLARKMYYTILLVVFYALPLIVMVILYSTVIVFLQRKKTPSTPHGDSTKDKKYKEASKKMLKMLIIVSVSFVACWATYFAAQIAHTRVPCSLRFWRFFLAHCNSALSPCLCVTFNRKYRNRINMVLYRWYCACCLGCEVDEDDTAR